MLQLSYGGNPPTIYESAVLNVIFDHNHLYGLKLIRQLNTVGRSKDGEDLGNRHKRVDSPIPRTKFDRGMNLYSEIPDTWASVNWLRDAVKTTLVGLTPGPEYWEITEAYLCQRTPIDTKEDDFRKAI